MQAYKHVVNTYTSCMNDNETSRLKDAIKLRLLSIKNGVVYSLQQFV